MFGFQLNIVIHLNLSYNRYIEAMNEGTIPHALTHEAPCALINLCREIVTLVSEFKVKQLIKLVV